MAQRLLVISHGHPRFNRGGGEHAAYAVHEHVGALPSWDSLFLAAAPEGRLGAGEDLEQLGEVQEWLVRPTDDWLLFESAVALGPGCALQRLIEAWQPDVVHWHHYHRLGLDLLLAIDRWCPQARTVFTLHEFLALCPFQGQLLTPADGVCDGPQLEACSRCLPEIDPADLVLREALLRRLMVAVDVFIAPSAQLAALYGAWGLEPERLQLVEYALPAALMTVYEQWQSRPAALAPPAAEGSAPVRFGFFGNVLPSKGLDLILEAFAALAAEQPEARLTVFGRIPDDWSALPRHHHAFYGRVRALLAELEGRVTVLGGYGQEDVPRLMQSIDWVVMASRWRENSPVVILEAKACRRPLLVPALGGMAEKVRDGLDGWHFQPGNAEDLAALMRRCCTSRQAWYTLVQRMAGPVALEPILAAHLRIYAS
jgi:glycosyltransferase involved in cell wall biosynthesis